jgi:hypothetical protein
MRCGRYKNCFVFRAVFGNGHGIAIPDRPVALWINGDGLTQLFSAWLADKNWQ